MRIRTRHKLLKLLAGLAIVVFLASLWDMFLNDGELIIAVLGAYAVLLFLALLLYVGHKPTLDPREPIVAEELDARPVPVAGEPEEPAWPTEGEDEEPEDVTQIEEVPKPRAHVGTLDVGSTNHFKCPFCSNVFGVAASHRRRNDFRVNCPFCANSVRVPKRPKVTQGDLSEFSHASPSERRVFACAECGEQIQFTAPHGKPARSLHVMQCPNCKSRRVLPAETA